MVQDGFGFYFLLSPSLSLAWSWWWWVLAGVVGLTLVDASGCRFAMAAP